MGYCNSQYCFAISTMAEGLAVDQCMSSYLLVAEILVACMILNEMLLERGVLRIPARRYENIPLRLSVLRLVQRVEYCISKGISESSGALKGPVLLLQHGLDVCQRGLE